MGKKKKNVYIFAYDPEIERRVVHVCRDGYAISIMTGHKFKYKPEKEKKKLGGVLK